MDQNILACREQEAGKAGPSKIFSAIGQVESDRDWSDKEEHDMELLRKPLFLDLRWTI